MKYTLSVRDYSLMVHLGCTPQEQINPQKVLVSLFLHFSHAPSACQTDQLKDTVCYAELCERMRQTASQSAFATVEHLASRLYEDVNSHLPVGVRSEIRLHKVQPPIENLTGGVYFEIHSSP